ncbi:MAG: CDP-alcohol phosphatidyltransferase family protein [Candidatus Protochlamydia sp.]|nr:CDP-alcohol phosphatidyltransferase family protein [Candidatus Protochlamydia sp.]
MRAPLALLFFSDNVFFRALAIILAMITDYLDGYLARRFKMTSQLGAFLDPLMDKIFVITASIIIIQEGGMQIWEALSLISRDFAVLLFGLYLALCRKWGTFKFRSILCGKLVTTLQFFVLLGLTFHLFIHPYIFYFFIILGILSWGELYLVEKNRKNQIPGAINIK